MTESGDVQEQALGKQGDELTLGRWSIFVVGILVGSISWGLGAAVSGGKDLYSSGLGILTAQITLSSAAFIFGLKKGSFDSLVLVSGEFLGLVAFFYTSADLNRGWVFVVALFAVPLLVLPAIAGLSGSIVKNVLVERGQRKDSQG